MPQGRAIKVTRAEALLRRVLASAPAVLFQHLMRTVSSCVLAPLDTRRSGYVDLGLLLSSLLALCDEPLGERLAAAYGVAAWRAHGAPVTRGDALDYVAALRVRGRLVGGARPLGSAGWVGGVPGEALPNCTHRDRAPRVPSCAHSQVAFSPDHDPAHMASRASAPSDGEFINLQVRVCGYVGVGGWVHARRAAGGGRPSTAQQRWPTSLAHPPAHCSAGLPLSLRASRCTRPCPRCASRSCEPPPAPASSLRPVVCRCGCALAGARPVCAGSSSVGL